MIPDAQHIGWNGIGPADVLGPRLFQGAVLTLLLNIKAGYERPFERLRLGISLSEDLLEKNRF